MREHPADRSWASRPVSLSRLPSTKAETVGTRAAVSPLAKPSMHGALELGYGLSFCLA